MAESDQTTAKVRQRRPGGRSAAVRQAVLSATVSIVAEQGFAGATVDAVASLAGVNPTTIYRRWESRGALVADALASLSLEAIPVPDTGTVRGDLCEILFEVRAHVTSREGRALVHTIIGSDIDAEVALLRQEFWTDRFRILDEVIQRGIDRNELPADVDGRFIIETATAAVYFRIFVVASEVDDAQIEQVVDLVLGGATS